MKWNWQQPDWPSFQWDETRLRKVESVFLVEAGEYAGMVKHLREDEREQLTVEAMSTEVVTTSEIEGEILDRASVQSSIRCQLGLAADTRRAGVAEQAVSGLMVDVHRTYMQPLDHDTLYRWHSQLMAGRDDLHNIGCYRTHAEPMQVVSGAIYKPRVHFEAPSSSAVLAEMARFIDWFNRTAPGASSALPALTRAGISHLYFACVHPFEDGNGRIARALSEKALAQQLRRPTLTALAATLLAKRSAYYAALEANNKDVQITPWLTWFAAAVVEAQRQAIAQVDFIIDKTRLLDSLRDQLNPRQQKALLRMLREGPQGFTGGLSAGKYISITGASPATATRDLVDLVAKGALLRKGERRHARYAVAIPLRPVAAVVIDGMGDVR